MKHLILVRHGESALNAANRAGSAVLCGQYETPLTDRGRQQAIAAAQDLAQRDDLRIATAVSSALSRAAQTLELMLPYLPPPISVLPPRPELNERSLGQFEGRLESELRSEWPEYFQDPRWMRFRDDMEQRAPGGENLTEVAARAWSCVEQLLAATSGDLLVVSHAMTIRTIVGRAQRLPPERWLATPVSNSQPIVLSVGAES